MLTRKPKIATSHGVEGRAQSRADDDPDRLREVDQSGADEAHDGERRRGRGLTRYREQHTGYNSAQSAGNERL